MKFWMFVTGLVLMLVMAFACRHAALQDDLLGFIQYFSFFIIGWLLILGGVFIGTNRIA